MGIRELLKTGRLNKGLTQAQIAEHLQMTTSIVTRWENGSAELPAWRKVLAWADLVGVEVSAKLVEGGPDPFDQLRELMTDEEARRMVMTLQVVKQT